MVVRIGRKLIWTLLAICLLLTIVLILLNFTGYQSPSILKLFNLKPKPVVTIGNWIVLPEKDFSGKTLVIMSGGMTLNRVIYQPIKLTNGYEAISYQNGNELSVSSRFVIFDLPYSDRNELSNEAITKYRLDKPFKEIYYCGNLAQPLTIASANKIINENKLKTTCQQINGFLY